MERLQRFALWTLQPKVGLPLALMLCLAASPFVYRATRLTSLPDCGHPFDVEAFGTQDVPDAENAFVEYRAAAKLYKETPFSEADMESFDKASKEGWSGANENVRKWVADNRACLEVWRRGTKKTDALYHQPKDLTLHTEMPLIQTARSCAQLMRLEGFRLEETGDLDAAWGWYHAMFRSGRHIGKRGSLIERLVGMAIHPIAAEAIANWAKHDKLTSDQLRQAIDELQDAYAMTAPASISYKCECLSLEKLIASLLLPDFADKASTLGKLELFLRNEPEVGRRVMRQVFANWLTQADHPRHMRTPQVPGDLGIYERDPTLTYHPDSLPPEQIKEFTSKSIVVAMLLPAMSMVETASSREQSQQNALTTMLALRLHRLETGHLPDTLDELVEAGILESVPIDPWHPTGKPLRYHRKNQTATVYSLGKNGIDDGGNFDTGSRKSSDIGFDIQPAKSNDEP